MSTSLAHEHSGECPSGAVGDKVLAENVLWHSIAGLNLLSAKAAAGLGSEGRGNCPEVVQFCANHDDGATLAVFECKACATALCSQCDLVFHLSKTTRAHARTAIKGREEELSVAVKDGTSRLKTPLLVLAVDSEGAKAVLELKRAAAAQLACRFCGVDLSPEQAAVAEASGFAAVCEAEDCAAKAAQCCTKRHPCGHPCGGVAGEEVCLPCLHGCDQSLSHFSDVDDYCQICWTESLSAAPSIRLGCGHVVHHACARQLLEHRWNGPVISFSPWSQCPTCKEPLEHPLLEDLTAPVRELREEVERKALVRLGEHAHLQTSLLAGAEL